MPSLPASPLPGLVHFQLPRPSPPPGPSAVHKNYQAKQEQSAFCKIRHFVNVYDAASRCPEACSGANPPGLTMDTVAAS